MARPDLTVFGAGIFGLSCAWAAARRGARVHLIEVAAVGAGASGGLVGALAPHVPEQWNAKKQFQLDSLLMAESWWQAVSAAGGLSPGYARLGRIQPLADAAAVDLAMARAQSAAGLWHGQAEWRVRPARADGWDPVSTSGMVVEDTLSARLSPRMAGAALTAALRNAGAQLTFGPAMAGLDTPTGGGAVLHATGHAGLLALNAALGQTLGSGVKGQAAAFRLDRGTRPQLFVDGLHIVPHADGTVAIGSTSENQWAAAETTDSRLDALIEAARAALPVLRDAPVIDRWAGIRPRARSRAPMLGPWPGRSGHFIANGGFKIGFGMAPKVAEVMADLILNGHDSIPDGFRVDASLGKARS